eukprot:gene10919-3624_t
MKIKLEFSGGLEILFGKSELEMELKDKMKLQELILILKEKIQRPELFVDDDAVRPGILVLINDTDYELLNELEYEIQDKDFIVFISTLHGG